MKEKIDLKNIQTEIDAAFLYKTLAETEKDPVVAKVFTEMSEIENGHALAFLKNKGLAADQMPSPSGRAKTLKRIGRIFGNEYILGVLLDTEKSLSASVNTARKKFKSTSSLSDTAHVTILKNILSSHREIAGPTLARFEKHHKTVGGNALRAAVLGGNDGLISNFSLVMGVAGASSGQKEVLLTGLAGLLAGALSMALGEWISVQSSKELFENQIQLEMEELENNPEGEERELALIYIAKGIEETQARKMAKDILSNKEMAHQVLVKEELAINPEELEGSAMEAAITSFVLFAIGAIIPVTPFFFMGGLQAVILSASLSAIGLFGIGAAITLFTGRTVLYSGFRQVIFGLLAAAITFGIGRWIGVSIAG